MIYENIINGVFINRPNRFIANVLVEGNVETVHVKNTGRCKELLVDGVKVVLQRANNPSRKTKFSLIAVYKGDILINMDSQVPNAVAEEALLSNKISNINAKDIKREVTFGKSRFDLFFTEGEKKCFMEVKGVTLEKNNVAMFPDAPTERGAKHLEELIMAKKEGYNAYILFLIQLAGVEYFTPNFDTDMKFANTLANAQENGVKILAYDSLVSENSIFINKPVKIKIK